MVIPTVHLRKLMMRVDDRSRFNASCNVVSLMLGFSRKVALPLFLRGLVTGTQGLWAKGADVDIA